MTPTSDSSGFLGPQPDTIPHPWPSPISQPYWDGATREELLYQRCADCGQANFDPAFQCRRCGSRALDWERSAGLGTLYSWTVVYRPVTPAFDVPYAPAIVDLDEGYQMMTNLIGLAPDAITPGLAVQAEFHETGGGLSLPYFRPRDTAVR